MAEPIRLTVREFGDYDEHGREIELWYAWVEGTQPSGIVEGADPQEALGELVRVHGAAFLSRYERFASALERLWYGKGESGRRLWARSRRLGLNVVLMELPRLDGRR